MAVRRSVDSLIQEFAKMRGVSPDHAVRIAISEALERKRGIGEEAKEEVSHASSIEAIYARGLAIAGSCGEDKATSQICSNVGPTIVLFAIFLLGSAFVERSLQSVILVFVLLCLVSLYFYWRSLQKIGRSRKQLRTSLALEIEELSQRFPDRLSFLAEPPEGDPYFKWIMIERERLG